MGYFMYVEIMGKGKNYAFTGSKKKNKNKENKCVRDLNFGMYVAFDICNVARDLMYKVK